MTIIRNIERKCSVCGKSSRHPMLASTNTSGYSDLDLRPSEMQRSTMHTWAVECPHCGYVAGDITKETEISKEFLKSEEYLTCEGHEFKSRLSQIFYKRYLISKQSDDVMMCFVSLRNCAWACDDEGDENSSEIRKLAVSYLDELIDKDEDDDNLILMKMDFLRRSGQFDKLISEYEGLSFGDELLDAIVCFQLEKAKNKDSECYTVEDVVG